MSKLKYILEITPTRYVERTEKKTVRNIPCPRCNGRGGFREETGHDQYTFTPCDMCDGTKKLKLLLQSNGRLIMNHNLIITGFTRLLTIAFIALIFVSCDSGNVSGYVVDMEYKPAHTKCRYDVVLKIPIVEDIPDEYVIWVADRHISRRIKVEKSLYKQLRKGQYVNLATNK
ncbi:MAG: zinc finger-like domain-containing protein [Parabacteroides sp.]|nr:zinc finger-like domain-containing protein [Parabacteroides sp.]